MYGREDPTLAAKKFYYMVVAIKESQNMDFLIIQGLMGKL